MNLVLWSIPVLLLLASIIVVLVPFRANEDPADPSATVREECGSLLSPHTLKTPSGHPYLTPVCEHARKARLSGAGQLLAWGAGTAAPAVAVHIHRRRRHRSGPAAELRHNPDH
ncbi:MULTISPECIES: hypothetical protein [unclassified Streptomyces]|uniref:hypothetical protein n=1 Tax=unclassified Streptomyces TaxID=2593676 RepID=UPI002DD880B6|nr:MULTISPECIES: hypothetical protein [unclassified Streptomyces]WSA96623.1 hypothetical protein OIE63_37515 [Streptomyces sp. NBC_01795]WSB81036.1 hypothetical protein OHB04_38625 [Streptomyces sp. NBC_01775]WSS10753.1 hypothetical protein OG533_01630 [Streptomyces sp. NBC_01186]WSS39450.1 hypothetical protein OG220_01665 [Streptomyces sp. NBC_01187]